MLLRKSWNKEKKANETSSVSERSSFPFSSLFLSSITPGDSSTPENEKYSKQRKEKFLGNCKRNQLVVLAICLWVIVTGALMLSSKLDLEIKSEKKKRNSIWYQFKTTLLGDKPKSNPHKHLLQHVDSRLAVFLASHAMWEDIINSYPKSQQKIWNDIITDSDSESESDSENESKDYKPKRSSLRGKRERSNEEAEIVVHRIVSKINLIDKPQNRDIDNSNLADFTQEHQEPIVFKYIRRSISNIPVPISTGDFSSALFGQLSDAKSLVVFSAIPGVTSSLSYWNIYEAFDRILAYIKDLQTTHSSSIVIWFPSNRILSYENDLQSIFHHLCIHYLMEKTGVIIVPPVASAKSNTINNVRSGVLVDDTNELNENFLLALDQQLTFVYKKLVLNEDRNDLHTMAWQGDATQIEFVAKTIRALFVGGEQHKHSSADSLESAKSEPSISSLHEHCSRFVNTRKYVPTCMPEPENRHPLLVTGLGGSGSHFVANQLQEMGFQVKHEGIGRDGAVSWFYSVNDYLLGLQYPFGKLTDSQRTFLSPRFDNVIHVIRNPLDQISSFTAHTNKSYDFVVCNMKVSQKADIVREFEQARLFQHNCFRGGKCHLHFAVLAWIHWNAMVAEIADKSYHIEQVGHLMEDLCTLLWPEYHSLNSKRRCPDERIMFLTENWWKAFQYYTAKQIFPSYVSHKKHTHYSLQDIIALDKNLDTRLLEAVEKFDYHGRFL
jgi:hypothetical protein